MKCKQREGVKDFSKETKDGGVNKLGVDIINKHTCPRRPENKCKQRKL